MAINFLRVCCDDSCWVDAAAYVGTTTSQGELGYAETDALEAMVEATIYVEFFIFNLSRFCKNIWSATNFAKIYICRRGPRRQGHNAVARGGRSRQEWAHTLNVVGHGVTYLTQRVMALGA
jgi:hypothetical protein